jgi:hypothetical protein
MNGYCHKHGQWIRKNTEDDCPYCLIDRQAKEIELHVHVVRQLKAERDILVQQIKAKDEELVYCQTLLDVESRPLRDFIGKDPDNSLCRYCGGRHTRDEHMQQKATDRCCSPTTR